MDPSPIQSKTSELRYLDPKRLRFFRQGATLRLTVADEFSCPRVTVVRAFPLSEQKQYLSVRDGANEEVGILVNLEDLDAENRRLVEEELERRYLVPVVHRVVAIKERFGTVDWEVETDRGLRKFTTRNLRENILQPSRNRYILTDVDGNRYDVRDLEALDSTSQGWLMRHL